MDGSWMLAWKDGIGGWEEEEETTDLTRTVREEESWFLKD